MPATIKDNIWLKGFPTRRGSKTSEQDAAQADSPAVARLREQDAIVEEADPPLAVDLIRAQWLADGRTVIVGPLRADVSMLRAARAIECALPMPLALGL